MRRILKKALLLAAFPLSMAMNGAAAASDLDFAIEKIPGYSGMFQPLYKVRGAGIALEIYDAPFQDASFARYAVKGSLFGRRLGTGNYIKSDDFGGVSAVIIETDDVYAKFSKTAGWPELEVETLLAPDADPRSVVLFLVLADYLPKLPGASPFGEDHQPTQSFSLRQLGDWTFVEGEGLTGVRVDRVASWQNRRYTVRGSGFGKDFDGADALEFEMDSAFLGPGGVRIEGCGMDLEIRRDGFGIQSLRVRGAAGDSASLAAFAMAMVRHISGAD